LMSTPPLGRGGVPSTRTPRSS